MTKLLKRKANSQSVGKAVLMGTILSLLISILLCMILAYLAGDEKIQITWLPAITAFIHGLSTVSGILFAIKLYKNRIGLITCICAATYCLLWMSISILGFEGQMPNIIISVLSILIGAGTAMGISLIHPTKKKYKRHSR